MSSEPADPFLSAKELRDLGLSRDAARFAAWVQATYWTQGSTWATQTRLAEDWCTTRQSVCRSIAALLAAGVWQRVRQVPGVTP